MYLLMSRLEAAKSGDMRRLEASALGGGQGGRGRGGNSNLPAWMTMTTTTQQSQPQPQQQSQPEGEGKEVERGVGCSYSSGSSTKEDSDDTANNRKRGMFTNPSCVLLLKNIGKKMDSNLEKEMAEECEKYGSIRSCVVRECHEALGGGPESVGSIEKGHVQVFICFAKQESAVRAFRDLNGRYFDGRQISASFYDETLFWRC